MTFPNANGDAGRKEVSEGGKTMEKKRELEPCADISPQLWGTKAQRDISQQTTSKGFMQSGKNENKVIFKMGPGEGERGTEKLGWVWARTSRREWGKDPV